MIEKLRLILAERLKTGDELFDDPRGYTRLYGLLLVKTVEMLPSNQILVMVGHNSDSASWSLHFKRGERVIVSEIQPYGGLSCQK